MKTKQKIKYSGRRLAEEIYKEVGGRLGYGEWYLLLWVDENFCEHGWEWFRAVGLLRKWLLGHIGYRVEVMVVERGDNTGWSGVGRS